MNEEQEKVVNETTETQNLEALQKSLNWERGQRKSLEKELKELKESRLAEDEEDIKQAEADIRAKFKNSKSGLSDDVIDDLMEVFGKSQAKTEVQAARKKTEKEIMELQRNPMYIDVGEHLTEIRQLMKKGLTAEQAYWACVGESKFAKTTEKAKEKEEKEEKQKLNKERAEQGYVDGVPASDDKMPTYTEKERYIAKETGMSTEEVRARSKATTLEEIQALNSKFKK